MTIALGRATNERCGAAVTAAAPGWGRAILNDDGSWEGDPGAAIVAYGAAAGRIGGSLTPLLDAYPLMPKLRWFHSFRAGVDQPQYLAMKANGVVVTNGAGTFAIPVAQYVFAQILLHAKPLLAWREQQTRRVWQRLPAADLAGQTLGIIGLGGIGQEVARLGRAFRMTVIGTRRTQAPLPDVDEVLPPARTAAVCARADYLVITAPLTAETRGLLDAAAFAVMKPSAYLINVARGAIVQEEALVAALQSGRIAGAALDVFAVEPLPADHALWSLPNVSITPHGSMATPHDTARSDALFIENLRRFVAGEPLVNVVDPALLGVPEG